MIPPAALALGLAGLLPFLWGALATHVPALDGLAGSLLGQRFTAPYVLVAYGTVILCFMAGVLWGFAAKGSNFTDYLVSVLPALWAFFTVGGGADRALLALAIGFAGLLVLDYRFATAGLAPPWWMRLRVLLTTIVLACLLIGWAG
jgi:hypothetical protein